MISRLVREALIFSLLSAITAHAADGTQAWSKIGKLPMSFEANQGQSHPSVKFLSHGSSYSLFLTAQEAVLTLTDNKATALRLRIIGGSREPQLKGVEALPGKA
ncbi:MAG: hypothetical protein HY236_08015, partial [Acidobacteria bacterium]|nr:hypothetical protein [Acidobacteriota bacterium]